MLDRPARQQSDLGRSHRARKGWGARAADEHRTRHSARAYPFLLLLRDFQPFTAPDALNSLVVHMPARVVQQAGDHAIAMAPVLAGQLDDVVCQMVFICTTLGRFALCRSVLAECATGAALRHAQLLLHMVDALAMTPKAQKFPFAASLKMTLPNVRSDTARRSRWLSFCNSFKRIGCDRCIPPYSFRHR